MLRWIFVVGCGLVFALVGSALGQSIFFAPADRAGNLEFSIQTRYVGERDFGQSGGSTLSTEDDLGLGFTVGYNLNDRINVGCFFAWRTVDYSAHIAAPEHTVDFTDWMDTASTGVNATLNLLKTRFTPYVQGAVGWAMVDTNIPAGRPDIDCFYDPWWGYICLESGANIGEDGASYALGAGLSWQLTETFYVRAGYEKNWIDIDPTDDFDVVRVDAGFLYR